VISSAEIDHSQEGCVGRVSAAIEPHAFAELESIDCPHCGRCEHETVLSASDQWTRLGLTFFVVRCRRCRLCFTNPRPPQETMGAFYPDHYGPFSGHEPGTRPRPHSRRRFEHAVLRRDFGYPAQPNDKMASIFATIGKATIRGTRRREFWIPYRHPGRLLDFGCGAGDFLKRMRQYGWTVEGIDVSSTMADRLRLEAGIRVHIGTMPHPDVRPESFDAITMWHSLEHVHNPRAALKAANAALRSEGILAISVPNFASWSRRHFQHHWFELTLPLHLTHFEPPTLRAMIEAEGFRILSLEQMGRGSSVKKSARLASEAGFGPWWLRNLRRSWPSRMTASWSERTGQADVIRVIAEKTS
jgi:2-polyprenyl-3-methyl-5-hydroxy-6-metoxy-1,4-benzoquinol methylase